MGSMSWRTCRLLTMRGEQPLQQQRADERDAAELQRAQRVISAAGTFPQRAAPEEAAPSPMADSSSTAHMNTLSRICRQRVCA